MRCLWPLCSGMYHTNTHKLANTHKRTHNGRDSDCSVLVWVTFSLFSWGSSLCGIKCLGPDHVDYCTFNWDKVKVSVVKTEQSILGDTESLLQITLKGSVQPQTRLPQIISSHAEDFCFIYRFWDIHLHPHNTYNIKHTLSYFLWKKVIHKTSSQWFSSRKRILCSQNIPTWTCYLNSSGYEQ